jgi:hypothetical protein
MFFLPSFNATLMLGVGLVLVGSMLSMLLTHCSH